MPARMTARGRCLVAVAIATLLVTGCAGVRSSSPAAVAPRASHTPVSAHATGPIATLHARGYTSDYHIEVAIAGGQHIMVFHSICTGSADGHCQEVDAFNAAGLVVWRRQYVDVLRLSARPGGFEVRSARYRPDDALCCPSGGASADVYLWKGAGFQRAIGHSVTKNP